MLTEGGGHGTANGVSGVSGPVDRNDDLGGAYAVEQWEVFLIKCFGQDEILAKSTNHLLVVGFYLINIGFIGVRLNGWNSAQALAGMIPYIGSKIGLSILILGGMHFFNMMMIARYGQTVAGWVHRNEERREGALRNGSPHVSSADP